MVQGRPGQRQPEVGANLDRNASNPNIFYHSFLAADALNKVSRVMVWFPAAKNSKPE
jgi:hypothetical protein